MSGLLRSENDTDGRSQMKTPICTCSNHFRVKEDLARCQCMKELNIAVEMC